MQQRHVVLDNGVPVGDVEGVSMEFGEATRHPELPRAADHRKLPAQLRHRVPRHHAEGAAAERARRDLEVDAH